MRHLGGGATHLAAGNSSAICEDKGASGILSLGKKTAPNPKGTRHGDMPPWKPVD